MSNLFKALLFCHIEIKPFDDVFAPGHAAARHAAGNNLCKACEIRRNAVVRLCAAWRNAKAGHHLIEDKHRFVFTGDVAQKLQELAIGRHHAHGRAGGFEDHRGNRTTTVERRADACFVIWINQNNVVRD